MSNERKIIIVLLGFIFASCSPRTQETLIEREQAIGQNEAGGLFAEAKMISEIENWKDDPGKIVFLYVNFPPMSDNILVLQCKGVPVSSTESLEPNEGAPWNTGYSYWKVPVDGTDVATNEMAGRDGTFGEPVQYRQCLTVDGIYFDLPAMGVPYIVSSVPYTFAPSTVKRDFEGEARLLVAEEIIRRGGCVNNETLVEIPCP
jgi:hypothetical protein